jgi:PqqD family protein of HPr-rel-A system
MARYARTEGLLIEPLDEVWAAFCPASGETALLNNESAAILEILAAGAADEGAVCAELARDCDTDVALVAAQVADCWSKLIEAGLVRQAGPARTMAR